MSEYLEITREGRLARIALNRPEKRNALNAAFCRELTEALEDAALDRATGAILLTANGPAFCAGMDLDEALTADPAVLHQAHEQLFTIGARLGKPLIAAVHGAALAGGTGLVANCHVVIAGDDARFGLTEIRIGLWPFVVFRSVVAAVGERRATEWSVTGRIFAAQEAWNTGLVQRVVPAGELMHRAAGMAAEIAESSPTALRAGFAFVNASRDSTPSEAAEMAREAREVVFRGPDFQEGVRAFREKRDPEWPSLLAG